MAGGSSRDQARSTAYASEHGIPRGPRSLERAEHRLNGSLARFLPWVRTLTPVAAGVGSMPYRRFVVMNLLGAAVWGVGLPVAGYFLGASVPNADHYILPAVLGIIVVSAAASSRQVIRGARSRVQPAMTESTQTPDDSRSGPSDHRGD